MKTWVKIVAGIVVAGTSMGMGGLSLSLNMAKNDLQEQCDGAARKNRLLVKKVQEEKAKAGALMHKSRAAESQLAGLRSEITSWEDKYQSLDADYHALQAGGDKKQKDYLVEIDRWSVKYANLKDELKISEKKTKDALEKIAEKEKEIVATEQNLASLQARLKRSDFKLAKCEEKNEVLYDVATGLLDKFENQSLLTGILKSETFVQLKRVELEKIVQTFQDKIEEAKVETFQQASAFHQ